MKSHLGTVILILAAIMTTAAFAQPDVDWLHTYGGDETEYFKDVCQAADGGFLMAGAVYPQRGFVLFKTSANGDQQWTRAYDENVLRFCGWVCPAADDGYFLVGAVTGTDQRDDLVVQKIAANGDPQWRYVMSDYWSSEISWAEATPDGGCVVGGFVISGFSTTAALLFKVDANGDSQWVRIYGGDNYDRCTVVLNAQGGGYYLVGSRYYAEDDPPDRLWVMRLSDSGEIAWSRTYSFPYRPEFGAAHLTPDGGLAVAGIYYEARGLDWYMGARVLVRIDPDGHRRWTRTYMTDDCMTTTALDGTSDGGFVMSGEGGMLRVNAQGDSLWCLPYTSYACLQLADNSYVLAGVMGSDNWDLFLLKTFPDPVSAGLPMAIQPGSIALHPNYPNPFNAVTTIRFDLVCEGSVSLDAFDLNGRFVRALISGPFAAGRHEVRFDAGDLPSGTYLCRLHAGSSFATQKVVLLK